MKNVFLKFSLIILALLLQLNNINAQTITIGTGTSTVSLPMNPWYVYSYSQSIFDQSEIATAGSIDKIRYYFNGNSSFTDNPVDIYIGHTSKTTFSSSSDWVLPTSLTLVYSGPVSTTNVAGWVEIDIADFTYDNVNNLVVALDENGTSGHTSSDDYYATSCSGSKSIYKLSDTSNPDPVAPPSGSLSSNRPNIQLEFVPSDPMVYDSSRVFQFNTSTVVVGEGNKEVIGIELVATNSGSPLNVTDFQLNMNGTTDALVDVTNVDIFCTGLSASFATTDLFGSATPSLGSINITGSKSLQAGSNYFWIAYDIDAAATPNNFIDAECTQVIIDGGVGAQVPQITTVTGEREIMAVPTEYLMNNASANTCYGIFKDAQGDLDYNDNQSYVKTFCSDNGENIRFDFSAFDIELSHDWLDVYDGPNTSATKIARYTSSLPGSVISTGSCLTFVFSSDCCGASYSGWEADITCFNPGVCGDNPPASDLCEDAPLLTSVEGICGSTGGYTADMPGNLQAEFCSGVNWINSNSWLQFEASETTVELAVVCNCPGAGVELGIFETTDCLNFTQVDCYSTFYNWAPGVFTATGLTVGNTYYLMIDGQTSGNCDFQINGLDGVVLPVALNNLASRCVEGAALITWTTSSELNNHYFTIERSEDGVEFETEDVVYGAGNSSERKYYEYRSNMSGAFYYRIKQTDFDGKFTYSELIFSKCQIEENTVKADVYPNPSQGLVNLSYQEANAEEGNLRIQIVNEFGQEVFKQSYSLASFIEIDLDLNRWSKGIYQVVFTSHQHQIIKKLVLTH